MGETVFDINSESAEDFFKKISENNPQASKIKVFTDNAGYFKKMVKDGLITDKRIEIKWLPTYSPNLNLIERLWKFMKKQILKNKYHGTAKGFREKIREFFKNIKDYKTELESLLTCNFRLVYFSQSTSWLVYNLNIGNLSHGAITGRMMEEIEKILEIENPDFILVYGDTNSTLAGA